LLRQLFGEVARRARRPLHKLDSPRCAQYDHGTVDELAVPVFWVLADLSYPAQTARFSGDHQCPGGRQAQVPDSGYSVGG